MKDLTSKDNEDLATLYDLPVYKALKRLMEVERFNIASKLLVWDSKDSTGLAFQQGQAHALKQINLKLKEIHKKLPDV